MWMRVIEAVVKEDEKNQCLVNSDCMREWCGGAAVQYSSYEYSASSTVVQVRKHHGSARMGPSLLSSQQPTSNIQEPYSPHSPVQPRATPGSTGQPRAAPYLQGGDVDAEVAFRRRGGR